MKNNVYELIKEYDITFNADISHRVNNCTIDIISDLFNEYVENIYSPSKEYKKLSKIANKKRDKLENTMTEKQKEMLEDYRVKRSESDGEIVNQAFVYGFCLANQIRDEIGNNYIIIKK